MGLSSSLSLAFSSSSSSSSLALTDASSSSPPSSSSSSSTTARFTGFNGFDGLGAGSGRARGGIPLTNDCLAGWCLRFSSNSATRSGATLSAGSQVLSLLPWVVGGESRWCASSK
eukprot:7306810-Prymnesium_polylepis.1